MKRHTVFVSFHCTQKDEEYRKKLEGKKFKGTSFEGQRIFVRRSV